MMKMTRIALGAATIMGAIVLIGCGGQNSTNSSFGGGSAGGYGAFGPNGQQNRAAQQANADAATQVPVFLSDGSGTQNEHLWVKLHEISIQTSNSPIIVFSDPAGRMIDLKSLRSADGPRFAYVGSMDPRSGDVVRAQIILDKGYSVMKAGEKEHATGEFIDEAKAEGDKVKYTVNLNPRLTKGENPAIILDVDLKKFVDEKDKKAKLAMRVGDASGVDDKSKQVSMDVVGTLGSIAGSVPAMSFSVGFGENRFQRVASDSSTQIFSLDGQLNPTLSDGNLVDVRGVYRYPERQFIAQSVRVREAGVTRLPHGIIGETEKFDAEKGTFEIAPKNLSGFTPGPKAVAVTTSETTIYLAANGAKAAKEDIAKALATPTAVEIDGEYDLATNTFKAGWVKLRLPDELVKAANPKAGADGAKPVDPKTAALPGAIRTIDEPIGAGLVQTPALAEGTVEGKATVAEFDPITGVFSLSNIDAQGLKDKPATLSAKIDEHTAYQNESGSLIGKTQFFEKLAKGKVVLFRGETKDGGLILRRLLLQK